MRLLLSSISLCLLLGCEALPAVRNVPTATEPQPIATAAQEVPPASITAAEEVPPASATTAVWGEVPEPCP